MERDLIRLTVETALDRQFNLRGRIARIDEVVADPAERALAEKWLRGFAEMSEGLVTSSIEQVVLGASSFRANELLAAAAATFAGVAARKATQHAFLWQMEIKL